MAVFFYDLLRTTRRGRIALLRIVYAVALLVALANLHAHWFPAYSEARGDAVPIARMAKFAEEFTGRFLFVQMGAMLLLTPALAAGAIVEERQRGTLSLLLTTHLTPLQIVVGKLASRAVYLFGVLLTGLPVLALLPLWGGVAPELVLTGFAVTGAGVISLSAVSLWCSARASTVRGAVLGSYAVAALICLFPPVCVCLNPFIATTAMFGGTSAIALWYIGCSLLWTAWLILAAARVLPVFNAPQVRLPVQPTLPTSTRLIAEPAEGPTERFRLYPPLEIRDRALLWKELHSSGSDVAAFVSRMLLFMALALGIGLMVIISSPGGGHMRDSSMVQVIAPILLAAAMLTTLLHATASISYEREQRTLDVLLTIPGGRDEVLRAKWLGSILYSRGLLIGVLVLLLLGVLGAGVDPLALPLLTLSAGTHLAFTASLGVFLSVTVRSSARAGFLGAAILLMVCLVPAVMCPCGYVWSPPVTWVASLPAAFAGTGGKELGTVFAVPFGLPPYMGLAAFLWFLARRRFVREGDLPAQ
jgi:ABC-type transport system involved in multi-copper enzyme maturation permease subunit